MGSNNQYIPEKTIERFFEDRVVELGLTADKAINQFKRKHGISKYMVTTLLRKPRTARIKHIVAMADVLQVEDWYIDLFEAFGFGAAGCTPDELNDLLSPEGYTLGRVVNVAA